MNFYLRIHCITVLLIKPNFPHVHLTSLHRMPYVYAQILPIDNRRTFKHSFWFLHVWPGALSTCHTWRAIVQPDIYMYMQLFLGVHGVMVWRPRTEGTANNERVYSFCWFLLYPFIQDLFLWHTCTSQEIVKMDLYPLSWGLYAVCSTGHWSIIGHCVGACQQSSCAEERWP